MAEKENQSVESEKEPDLELNDAVIGDKSFNHRQSLYASMKESEEKVVSDEESETSPEEEEEQKDELESEKTQLAETSPEEEKEEQKMVPLAALHESREQTRETKGRIRQLEQQLSEVIGSYKDIVTQKTKTEELSKDDEPIEDVDAAIFQLRRENRDMKKTIKASSDQLSYDHKQTQKREKEASVRKLDRELSEEGFAGFSDLADEVAKDILAITDPDEQASYMSADGWKRMYRERTSPRFSKLFSTQKQKEKFAQKDELARKASLVENPGKVKKAKSKESSNTFEDYLSMRAKSLVL